MFLDVRVLSSAGPEIENRTAFSPEHLPAIEKLSRTYQLIPIRRINVGMSGAGVYLVIVENRAGKRFVCILKVGTREDISSEIEYSRHVHNRLGDAVPEVIDSSPEPEDEDGFQAIVIRLATDDTIEPPSLHDMLKTPGINIAECLGAVADLLVLLNPVDDVFREMPRIQSVPMFLHDLTLIGKDASQTRPRLENLVQRLHKGGVRTRNLKNSVEINFTEERTKLPNPVYYALEGLEDRFGADPYVHPMLGSVHGDLFGPNILFERGSALQPPKLIDFAKSAKRRPFLFDWLYLEFDLLYSMSPVDDLGSWIDWMELVRVVTHTDEDIHKKPYETISEDRVTGQHWQVVSGVEAIRGRLEYYWNEETLDLYKDVAFWLTGYYVGLNYARKRGIQTPELNEQDALVKRRNATFKRYAALYYSARCLQRLFDILGKKPWQEDEPPMVGPHKYLFVPMFNLPDEIRSHIYLCATDDLYDAAGRYAIMQKDHFLLRPPAHQADAGQLLTTMRATRHFLCLIGSREEEEYIRDHNWRTTVSAYECEMALAAYSKPSDRCVLMHERAKSKLVSSHPVLRDTDGYEFDRDFTIVTYKNDDEMHQHVRRALVRWGKFDNKPPFRPDPLYPYLTWHGLSKKIDKLPHGNSIYVLCVVGDDDAALREMLWTWLRQQVGTHTAPRARHQPALVHTQDHVISNDFILHVLDGWLTSRDRSYPPLNPNDTDAITEFVLEDIVNWLHRGNVYFLMPEFNGYESALEDFSRLLEARLGDVPMAQRLVFIVEDTPNAYDLSDAVLSLDDMQVSLDDFAVYVEEEGGNLERFIRADTMHLTSRDVPWAEVLFGQNLLVSPVELLHNFSEYVNLNINL